MIAIAGKLQLWLSSAKACGNCCSTYDASLIPWAKPWSWKDPRGDIPNLPKTGGGVVYYPTPLHILYIFIPPPYTYFYPSSLTCFYPIHALYTYSTLFHLLMPFVTCIPTFFSVCFYNNRLIKQQGATRMPPQFLFQHMVVEIKFV